MISSVSRIDDFMTRCPVVVAPRTTVTEAARVLRENAIRHLPVVEGGALVGLVTDRDLHLVQSLVDVEPGTVTVGNVMEPDPFRVASGTPLHEVVSRMAAGKLGSAVVVDGAGVSGIFTTIDALRALGRMLLGEPASPARDGEP